MAFEPIVNLIPLYIVDLSVLHAVRSNPFVVGRSGRRDGPQCISDTTLFPAQLQAVNPILILVFIPLFRYVDLSVDWAAASKSLRFARLASDCFSRLLSFVIIALAQAADRRRRQRRISPGKLSPISCITAAEVMVSITRLEFSYTQAPRKMKSFVMGVYLLVAIALGNFFTARSTVTSTEQKRVWVDVLEGANYFWFFTGVMLVTACRVRCLVAVLSRRERLSRAKTSARGCRGRIAGKPARDRSIIA